MRLYFNCKPRSIEKFGLILIFSIPFLSSFAQLPTGAKETFHFKIEQENRICLTNYQMDGGANTQRSELSMSNGALLEIAIRRVTFGATFLKDYKKENTDLNKIDLDFGYEFDLINSLKLQAFVGVESNDFE